MSYLLSSILLGFRLFPICAVLFTAPILLVSVFKYKTINFMRVGLDYAFLLYGICVMTLVFFPLPSPEVAATLHTHTFQYVPFQFVADIVRESPLDIHNVTTFLPALLSEPVLQYVFNILLFVPLGMFLHYYFGMDKKKVILISFAVTCFIEIAQLTGLFFIYSGSYRVCDVDDLMANTLGGFLGYQVVTAMKGFLPSIEHFDTQIAFAKHAVR